MDTDFIIKLVTAIVAAVGALLGLLHFSTTRRSVGCQNLKPKWNSSPRALRPRKLNQLIGICFFAAQQPVFDASRVIKPPIIIAAVTNLDIQRILQEVDKSNIGNNNGRIDTSEEFWAVAAALQRNSKTPGDIYNRYWTNVISKIKVEGLFPPIILQPQADISCSLYWEDGRFLFTDGPFKAYDITKGVRWSYKDSTVTAEGVGKIGGVGGRDILEDHFISHAITIKGANKIVVTVEELKGDTFLLDGSGSGLEIGFPWYKGPGELYYPWLVTPAGHNYTNNNNKYCLTNLKKGDKLVYPVNKLHNSNGEVKFQPGVYLQVGEIVTVSIKLE